MKALIILNKPDESIDLDGYEVVIAVGVAGDGVACSHLVCLQESDLPVNLAEPLPTLVASRVLAVRLARRNQRVSQMPLIAPYEIKPDVPGMPDLFRRYGSTMALGLAASLGATSIDFAGSKPLEGEEGELFAHACLATAKAAEAAVVELPPADPPSDTVTVGEAGDD
jgi:hypothetical protein